MPIINPTDDAPVYPAPSPVQITKPTYKGVTVDTEMIPLSSLLTHVEGSSWNVNYYSQVLDLDSPTAGQELGTSPVHQQYRLIQQMELKVTAALSTTQDPETKTLTHSGAATVYPFVIPNEGDMFLADIGDGREGVFKVTSSRRLSIFQQTCHEIEYSMVDYSNEERRTDLNNKVVQTFQYVRDFLQYGQNPLLFEEEYATLQYLRKHYKALATEYFKLFYSREYSVLLVPLQLTPTYDHYLTKALLDNFTTWDTEEIRYIRKLNVDDDNTMKATQIWDVLTDKNPNLLLNAFTQVGKVYSSEFSIEPLYEGIRFSGIKEIIYPIDPVVTVDFSYNKPPKLVSGSEISVPATSMKSIGGYLAQLRTKTLDDVIDDNMNGFYNPQEVDLGRQAPLYHPAMKDGYYVLSRGFYENDLSLGAQSKLDICVRRYINDQAIDMNVIKEFFDDIHKWNPLDKFYLTPIVLILAKSIIRSI